MKEKILEAEESNFQYKELVVKLQQGIWQKKIEDYKLGNDEILRYRSIIHVPNSQELKILILMEMHNVPYVRHPRY
jgi:hypothetical protein